MAIRKDGIENGEHDFDDPMTDESLDEAGVRQRHICACGCTVACGCRPGEDDR